MPTLETSDHHKWWRKCSFHLISFLRYVGLLYYIGSIPYRLSFAFSTPYYSERETGSLVMDYSVDFMFLLETLIMMWITLNKPSEMRPSEAASSRSNRAIFSALSRRGSSIRNVFTKAVPLPASDRRSMPSLQPWIVPLCDLFAALPLEAFAFASGRSNYVLWRLWKLLRVWHYNRYWDNFQSAFSAVTNIYNPSILRFLYVAIVLAIMGHIGACCFYVLGIFTLTWGATVSWATVDGFARLQSDGQVDVLHSSGYRYLRSIYWSVQHLDTVGFGDVAARNHIETWFVICFFIVAGSTLFYSNANMMTALMNWDADRAMTVVKKARFAKYAAYRNLPSTIRTKVENFYEYQYQTMKGLDEAAMVATLPVDIAQHIHNHKYHTLLREIELFGALHVGLLHALSAQLELHLFHPGDLILGTNQWVQGVYFIERGEVSMLSVHSLVERVYRSRSWFGVRALHQDYRATHGYLARSYVEVCFLRGSVFRAEADQYMSEEELAAFGQQCWMFKGYAAQSTPVALSKYRVHSQAIRARTQKQRNNRVLARRASTSPFTAPAVAAASASAATAANEPLDDHLTSETVTVKPHTVRSTSLLHDWLHPTSRLRRSWAVLIFFGKAFYVTTAISLIALTYRFVHAYEKMYGLLVVSYLVDVLFLGHHIGQAWLFPYVDDDGIVVTDGGQIWKHYRSRYPWWHSLLANAPIDIVVGVLLGVRYVPFLRLLKLLHAETLFASLEAALELLGDVVGTPLSFEVRRFVTLYFCLFEVLHWAANAWLFVAYFSVEAMHYDRNWIMNDQRQGIIVRIDRDGDMFFVNYTRAIYWASIAMSSIGLQDIIAANAVEVSAAVLIMFFGYFAFNVLVGAAANMMGAFNREQREFHAKMKRLQGLLAHTAAPAALVHRIERYYDYAFSRFGGIDEQAIFDALPPTIRVEVIHHVVAPFVRQVPFFAQLSEPVERMLFALFESRILLNNEALMIQGEIGKEMFVIERGKIEVTSANRSVIADQFPKEYEAITAAIRATIAEKQRLNALRWQQAQADAEALKKEQFEARRLQLIAMNKARAKGLRTVKQRDALPSSKTAHRGHVLTNVLRDLLALAQRLNRGLSGISPQSTERLVWDLLVYVTLLYYLIAIPLRLALPVPSQVYVVDFACDLVNLADVYAHARVFATYIGGELTATPAVLTRHYFSTTGGVLDTLAVLPFDVLALTFSAYPAYDDTNRHSSFLRLGLPMLRALLRIPKLCKVVSLSRYSAQVDRCVAYWKLSYTAYQVVSLTASILLVGHWIACGWYLLAEVEFNHRCASVADVLSPRRPVIDCHYIGTWVEQQWTMNKLPADGGSPWKRYLRALNFAIPLLAASTMGDVLGINENESLYTFFVVVCALSVSGMIIGSLVNVVVDASHGGWTDDDAVAMEIASEKLPRLMDTWLPREWRRTGSSKAAAAAALSPVAQLYVAAASEQQDESDSPRSHSGGGGAGHAHPPTLADTRRIVGELVDRARAGWAYLRSTAGYFVRHQDAIAQDLPPALRQELLWLQRGQPLLQPCPFLRTIPVDVLQSLSAAMETVVFQRGDVLVHRAERPSHVFFVQDGQVAVQLPLPDTAAAPDDSVFVAADDGGEAAGRQGPPMMRLALLGAGDYVGENALLAPSSPSPSSEVHIVAASSVVVAYRISRAAFWRELRVLDGDGDSGEETRRAVEDAIVACRAADWQRWRTIATTLHRQWTRRLAPAAEAASDGADAKPPVSLKDSPRWPPSEDTFVDGRGAPWLSPSPPPSATLRPSAALPVHAALPMAATLRSLWQHTRPVLRGGLLLYYLVTVPLYVAFCTAAQVTGGLVAWEIVAASWWCYETLRHASSLCDVVAAFPVEWLLLAVVASSSSGSGSHRPGVDYRFVLLLRGAHLWRPLAEYATSLHDVFVPVWQALRCTAGVGEVLEDLAQVGQRSWTRMMQSVLAFCLVSHWLACGFFAIHRYADRHAAYTYLTVDGRADYDATTRRHALCSVSVVECYARSLYFVLSTTTSTGIGDVQPYTDHEVLWTQVAMIGGAYSVAIVVACCGLFQSLVDAHTPAVVMRQTHDAWQHVFTRATWPVAIRQAIVAQWTHRWRKYDAVTPITTAAGSSEVPWFDHLSTPTHEALRFWLHRPTLQRCLPWLFAEGGEGFPAFVRYRLAAQLRSQVTLASTTLYEAGDPGHAVYFVVGGRRGTTTEAQIRRVLSLLLQPTPPRDTSEKKVERDAAEDDAEGDAAGDAGSWETRRGGHVGAWCLATPSGLRLETVRSVTSSSELFVLHRGDVVALLAMLSPALQFRWLWGLLAPPLVELRRPEPPPLPPPSLPASRSMRRAAVAGLGDADDALCRVAVQVLADVTAQLDAAKAPAAAYAPPLAPDESAMDPAHLAAALSDGDGDGDSDSGSFTGSSDSDSDDSDPRRSSTAAVDVSPPPSPPSPPPVAAAAAATPRRPDDAAVEATTTARAIAAAAQSFVAELLLTSAAAPTVAAPATVPPVATPPTSARRSARAGGAPPSPSSAAPAPAALVPPGAAPAAPSPTHIPRGLHLAPLPQRPSPAPPTSIAGDDGDDEDVDEPAAVPTRVSLHSPTLRLKRHRRIRKYRLLP
eukprot:gene12031-8591_t